jgi:hypothetical protein
MGTVQCDNKSCDRGSYTEEFGMDLQKRMERLEHEKRRLKVIAFGLLLFVAAVWALYAGIGHPQLAFAQDPKGRLEQRSDEKLEIVDKNGDMRIRPGCEPPPGIPTLGFTETDGTKLGTSRLGPPGARKTDPVGTARPEAFDPAQ